MPHRHVTAAAPGGALAYAAGAARSRRQPPLAPAGADAAPGMLAAPPVVPLPGMPDGAVDGAGAMPPVALELAPVPPVSVSLFF
ncbi:hypothetical protein [Burkholderia sp. Bp9142]|uniref:hypothetical protein n=1 Tax=Burkholderia sp. Bp9142 TaxID=2184573 RepID=UPI0021AB1BC2|nr:hypothetical protein [Burkholderia sp. Bp9142]